MPVRLCLPSMITKFEGCPHDWVLKLGWGGFWLCDAISRKRCEIELRWQLITNRKSYMGFRLQQKLITLNDLERQFTALSTELCVFWRCWPNSATVTRVALIMFYILSLQNVSSNPLNVCICCSVWLSCELLLLIGIEPLLSRGYDKPTLAGS